VQDVKLSPRRERKKAVGEGSAWLARRLDAGTADVDTGRDNRV